MKGKLLSCLLAAVLMLTIIPQIAFAEDTAENSDHEKIVEATIQAISEQFGDESRDPYNYLDKGSGGKLRSRASAYPEYFDLRNVDTDNDGKADSNYVTPVKFQNPFGSCWGFAAIAAAETSILGNEDLNQNLYSTSLKQGEDGKEVLDLSEKHLVYFTATHLDDPSSPQNGEGTHCEEGMTSGEKMDLGGVSFYATSLFSSGIGPNITARAYPASSGITDGDMTDILAYKGRNGEVQMRKINGKWESFCYSPDDDWSIDEKYRFLQSYKLKESFILPDPAGRNAAREYEYNPAATEAIKKQLYSKRAVQIAYKSDSSRPDETRDGTYISKNWAHYTYKKVNASHAVTIVGWDDNYDKSNFIEGHEPPENGAWLVKNSWGAEDREFPDKGSGTWGLVDPETGLHTGYFWLSYYDQSLEKAEALDFDQSNIGSQYYIDQHDYMPVSDADSGVVEASVSTSNIFQADQSQKLTQVSCQTAIPGTTVSYEVYLLSDSFTDPQDGIRVASEEETYEFGGFHKISLSTPVLLQKGQKYSIVITQIVPDGRYAFSMQYGVGETLAEFMDRKHWQEGIINKGESFICIDGEWLDLDDPELLEQLSEGSYDLYECDNFPIKGYSEKVAEMPVIRITGVDELSLIEPNKSLTLSLRFHGPSADFPEEPKITWSVPDEYREILSVEPRDDSGSCDKAVVTAKGYGTGFVTVEVEDVGTAVIKISSVRHKIKRVTFEGGINKFEYTGEPITPKVIPECEHWCADLEEGKDYEVSYENNIEPGTATAIVTGVGDHQSVVRKTFIIEKTGEDPVPCDEHNFGEWRILKEPTCAEMGSRERECSVCGYVETEEISTIAHTMEEFGAIEPSCTQDGSDLYYHCITCGNYYADAEGTTIIEEGSWIVPATGHKWGDWYEAKPSTCVKKGQMARTCLNDPEHIEYAETDLLDHKLQKINVVEPTCMESGKIEYWLCDSCGQLFADKDGKEVITEKDTIVPAKGHDWDDLIIVEQPTCTTPGVRTYTCTCSDCGEIYSETKELPALGHSFSEWTTTKEATEIAEGQQTRRCSVCGATETEVLPQLKPTLTSVKISKLTAGKKSATVKWKKLSKTKLKKISKIQIQYSTSKDFSKAVKTKYVSAKKTSYKIKSLKKGKKYYVRIRAYKKTGGEVHVSKWSTKKPVKIK